MGSATNSNKKKNLSNLPISDTQTSDRLFSVFFSIMKDGKVPKDIPNGSIYRYTKILKDKRIIKKIGFGVWGVAEQELATKFRADYYTALSIKKSPGSPPLGQSHFPVTDKRGHRLLLVITTPALDLGKIRAYLDYKSRGYPKWVNGGGAGKYLKCTFGNAWFSIYRDKVVVEFNKSFFAEHHITTQLLAMAHYKPILTTFEDNVGQSIRIGKELLVKDLMEFEKVNSDYAKYCYYIYFCVYVMCFRVSIIFIEHVGVTCLVDLSPQ